MAEQRSAGQTLRQQAEAVLVDESALSPERRDALSPENTERMLHELRVHQIELELQNEELRQTQVVLDMARARYFELYDLAPVGYCTLSEAGLILQSNLRAAALLGVPRAALGRQAISRFILKADQDVYYLHRKQVLDTGVPQVCELRMVKDDGTPFWAQLASTVAHEPDGAASLRTVLSDVSARRLAEAERATFTQVLQDKNAELERARLVAEKANRGKSEFLSSMSHELRTPLTAILGFAQLMETGSPPPTGSQKRSIDQILKAGWHLLGLINEILDLALIESGTQPLAVEAISLPEVMSECRELVEQQAEEHGVSLSFPRFDIPSFVLGDRRRLKQILINLLANAIKYNQPGGLVSVGCTQGFSGSLRISVRDTGAGLAPEQLAQLFQPFNRLGQEAGIEEGTGIGLVVCKRLIEWMGGVIGVDSTVGKGSTFWIELKLAAQTRSGVGAAASTVVEQPLGNVREASRTLLYVEDNSANRMLVEEIIARRPEIDLLTAIDGQLGIQLARAARPDAILMDINLPDISGIDALRILAEDPATAHIPVIALSANAMPSDREKGLQAGFFQYLTKPIRMNELMDALDVALKFARTDGRRAYREGGP